ncbi:VanZ family protein [Pseudalkalibacillus caeni]|uniref:VanZ-like domain-containing protein n=1 Tax=Exobacillus caeni TaxID=2574798 RepID=A0A5R9F6F3_9BACL|nr:VanZ family protein [Pseudalkalibacillus caeni]TLS38591.1 hypothetical protein FCL54_03575 [Pseudalkalibacillus caeni]
MKFVRYFFLILPFGYMGLIWYLSSHPQDHVIDTGLSYDSTIKEALHLVEFATLYVLWLLFFYGLGKLTPATNKLSAFLAIAYGFLDEIHQSFVPSRSATLIDLIKDTIGVLVCYIILKQIYKSQIEIKGSNNIEK